MQIQTNLLRGKVMIEIFKTNNKYQKANAVDPRNFNNPGEHLFQENMENHRRALFKSMEQTPRFGIR